MTLLDVLMEQLVGKKLTHVPSVDESHPCIGQQITHIGITVDTTYDPEIALFTIETANGEVIRVDEYDEVMCE